MEFKFPVHFEDLELNKSDRICVSSSVDYSRTAESEVLDVIDVLTEKLLQNYGIISALEQENFDTIFSLSKHFNDLSVEARGRYLDLLGSCLKALKPFLQETQSDGTTSRRQHQSLPDAPTALLRSLLKFFVYMLCNLLMREESRQIAISKTSLEANTKTSGKSKGRQKKNKDDEFVWEAHAPRGLEALAFSLGMNVQKVWTMGVVEEEFANLFCKTALHFLQNPVWTKSRESKNSLFQMLMYPVVMMPGVVPMVTASLLDLVSSFEHLAQPMVEMMILLREKHENTSIVRELVREIGRMVPTETTKDTNTIKFAAAFLSHLSSALPTIVLSNISSLLSHLDGPSYYMRSALVICIGNIVAAEFNQAKAISERQDKMKADPKKATGPAAHQKDGSGETIASSDAGHAEEEEADADGNAKSRQRIRDRLLDLLSQHTHDVNSFTRAAALRSWMFLVQERAVPVRRLDGVTALAVDRLKDKAVVCRRAALQLLTCLLEHNPFMGKLDPEFYREQAEQLKVWLQENARIEDGGSDDEGSETKEQGQDQNEGQQSDEQSESDDDEGTCSRKSQRVNRKGNKESMRDKEAQEDSSSGGSSDEENLQAIEKEMEAFHQEVQVRVRLLSFVTSALSFISQVQHSLTLAAQLLQSRNSGDVVEAIRFFARAESFQIPNARRGIIKMLALSFSEEESVREEVLTTVKNLYFLLPDGSGQYRPASEIVSNLIDVVEGASLGTLTSMEKTMELLMHQDAVPGEVVRVLWEVFAKSGSPEAHDAAGAAAAAPLPVHCRARAALCLLSMLASAKPWLLSSQRSLSVLSAVGLGEGVRARRDWAMVRLVALALQKAAAHKSQRVPARGENENNGKWLPGEDVVDKDNHKAEDSRTKTRGVSDSAEARDAAESALPGGTYREIVDTLQDFVCGDWDTPRTNEDAQQQATNDKDWYSAAEESLNAIFLLCEQPELETEAMVKKMTSRIFSRTSGATNTERMAEAVGDKASTNNGAQSLELEQRLCPPAALAHLFFVVGHVALKTLIHTENLATKLKRLRAANPSMQSDLKKARSKPNRISKSASGTTSEEGEEDEDASTMEQELGMAAEMEAEAEELVQDIAQNDIVNKNLLGVFGPLLVRVAGDEGGRFASHSLLRGSAVLALCKFMALSPQLCKQNLRLLFTILERDAETAIRSTVVVALGDLAFRWPNLVEPWTSRLYQALRDREVKVRRSALMVLTHLILNDMIKVKGQVSDIALSLEDSDERVRGMASLFFTELAKKGNNPIYNLLPDTIGRLSKSELVTSESFRTITRFLLTFIKKEKQLESLVEKLVHRFTTSGGDLSQCRDLSFCLSQLNLNEKSARRLADLFSIYKPYLQDAEIYKNFLAVLSKSKKFAKIELKEVVDELEAKIVRCHEHGGNFDENDDTPVTAEGSAAVSTAAKASKSRTKSARKTAKKQVSTRSLRQSMRKMKVAESSGEEDGQEDDIFTDSDESVASLDSDSNGEEDEDQEEDVDDVVAARKASARRGTSVTATRRGTRRRNAENVDPNQA